MPLSLLGDAAPAAEPAFQSGFAYFRWLHDLLPAPFFHTQAFLAFFALVLLVYWSIPRRFQMTRVWVLVIASFHFYAAWSYELAFLVAGTTVADYLFARVMGHSERPRFRKLILFTSIGMNLGILCYFKYRGFFLNELYDGMRKLGMEPGYEKLNPLGVFIPFGISFYTFEAISYAVDVYRRKIPAEKSLPRFLLFILFFPHLVAGPIVRAGDFLTQTRRAEAVELAARAGGRATVPRSACSRRWRSPTAWRCSATRCWRTRSCTTPGPCGSRCWPTRCASTATSPATRTWPSAPAHLLGYKLINNFNMPYLAANVSDFWRRWHISLSNWLRDYIFIPLGRESRVAVAELPQPACSRWRSAGCGTGPRGATSCGASRTARCS